MDEATKARVRLRAEYRCEYCGTRQVDEPFFAYQIEHVIAKQHGGLNEESNLALACSHCNLHKGPNLAGIDPITGQLTPLFHPRRQIWDEHFANRGPLLMGRTAVGRATVQVLNMNDRIRVVFRSEIPAQ